MIIADTGRSRHFNNTGDSDNTGDVVCTLSTTNPAYARHTEANRAREVDTNNLQYDVVVNCAYGKHIKQEIPSVTKLSGGTPAYEVIT